MKQTAVVFEAKIRSAGSAIGLNDTTCADSMRGGEEQETWRGGERLRKRERGGEKKGGGASDEGSV